jgi:hypothetical protein
MFYFGGKKKLIPHEIRHAFQSWLSLFVTAGCNFQNLNNLMTARMG